ncbi:MAG TPA: hypothetical protein VF601_02370 [Beijerinckiaceae bacterium]|jgi:hypothetical protein
MRHLFATLGTLAFVLVAAPAVRAAPVSADSLVQALPDAALAYAKKGGKGWKGGKKAKWRGGPPPWAPAHGLRRKRGW